jgi:hypothetical protein
MKLLNDFHNAILMDDATQITPTIKPHPHLTPVQQFAVYSDGYRIRLVQAIRSDYPILLNLLGEKEFDKIAHGYIKKYPPTNYNLDYYPNEFTKVMDEHCDDKFACEVAMLEGAIAEVFMLPDSDPLSADGFSNISLENFGAMTLKLRTACRLLQFSYQTSDWLTFARANNSLPLLQSERGQKTPSWLLVVRHNNEVQRHNLSEQEYTLLQNLADGKNVSDALEKTLSEHELHAEIIATSLQRWFADWVKNGVFVA